MKNKTYVIGEIGQNHNGSEDIANKMIQIFSEKPYDETFNKSLKGVDALKFTKRDLRQELTDSAMNRPYNSPHSFGKTYGEHRAFLELDDDTLFRLYKSVKGNNLDYVITLTSLGCQSIFSKFYPDKLKVASRDLTNLPLLEMLGETKIPLIISTGMADKKDLDNALSVVLKYHEDVTILHCVSEYPTQYHNVNLNTIPYLQKSYPQFTIGYSDHTIGISTALAAVAMGAEVIEKHITLDRTMKGTDQAGSCGPSGFMKMLRDIRNFEDSLGIEDIFMSSDVQDAKTKLARSIATKRTLSTGDVVSIDDLHLLSPGDGFSWGQLSLVVGKRLKCDVNKNEIIYESFLE